MQTHSLHHTLLRTQFNYSVTLKDCSSSNTGRTSMDTMNMSLSETTSQMSYYSLYYFHNQRSSCEPVSIAKSLISVSGCTGVAALLP